jgi:hypothetical protein
MLDPADKQALQAASGMDTTNKIIITVDEDIDPKDPEMVMWAMSFAMQPHRDAQIVTGKSPLLDPSAYALMTNPEERFFPPPVGCSVCWTRRARANIRPSVCPKSSSWSAPWRFGAKRKCPSSSCVIPGTVTRSIFGPPMTTSWRRR